MSAAQQLFEKLLEQRGLNDPDAQRLFLYPEYEAAKHDPWLLPDMEPAVQRLIEARDNKDHVVIYGDYDIDGLTATTLLFDAFRAFGIDVDTFIPNRFVEGYGLSKDAVRSLAEQKYDLIVTVDCGSLSHEEIALAGELGVDVIVTDHHSVAETMPTAIATINPKRPDHNYPFIDLAGVGVAFKLVQAMQQKMDGLPVGQEKWLLDLVAMGTVCDVVSLVNENRANVYWGLKVLQKTRRIGLKTLAKVAGVEIGTIKAQHLGFVIGPHLNASGRLKTAQLSLDVLTATEPQEALELATKLREMNLERKAEQQRIFKEALAQADEYADQQVLVLSGQNWSHGIIGIVAAKVLEKAHKPTFVLEEMPDGIAKGSARSYGDFSAVEAINYARPHIEKGGGHKLAAGVTMKREKINDFRSAVNEFYQSLQLVDQHRFMQPVIDVTTDCFDGIDLSFLGLLEALEPFGNSNPEPILKVKNVTITNIRLLGTDQQHLKVTATDKNGKSFQAIGFNMGDISAEVGQKADIALRAVCNEWQGRRNVEGHLVALENAAS